MDARLIHSRRHGLAWLLLLASVAAPACSRPEDPARRALRDRLRSEARMSDDELALLRAEVDKTIAGKTVRVEEPAGGRELRAEQRALVFGMLADPAGVFDEGLRHDSGTSYRVLNGPGDSDNAEIEATVRLWIDVATLVPRRFEFTYAFPGYGDYAYTLLVDP